MSDTITILRCARGLRLTKLIRPDEIVTYDSTRTYDGWTVPVSGLADIEKLISDIIHKPRLCVVRGRIIGGDTASGIRRLVHRDPKTGDQPTLVDMPHRWATLDVEGIRRPPNIDVMDLQVCAKDALRHFPRPFREAACLIQASAGHGIKPDHRLRLWFWLSRSTSGQELKRWLKGCPADPSIFGAAQVIYTSAPVFEGREDHIPIRLASLAGEDTVTVPSPERLAPPPRKTPEAMPEPSAPGASEYARAVMRNAATRVSRARVDNRHPTCIAQSLRLARFVSAGSLSAGDVQDAMGTALAQAGKTKEEGAAIAAWAISQSAGARS